MFGTLSRPHLNPNLQTHMPWGVRVVVGHASTTVFFYFFYPLCLQKLYCCASVRVTPFAYKYIYIQRIQHST
jgi:hypothetical protein